MIDVIILAKKLSMYNYIHSTLIYTWLIRVVSVGKKYIGVNR